MHCAQDYDELLMEGQTLPVCSGCGGAPAEIRRFEGVVYVLSNPHQSGVKVGFTRKSLAQRIKQLNGTGVPGRFSPIAIFPCKRPEQDERKVHGKLQKHRIEKEHFAVSEVDAVLGAYRALGRREPIFFDEHVEELFGMRLKKDRLEMQIRLKGKKAS